MKRNVLMRNLKVITASSMITFVPFAPVNATGLPVVDIAHIGIQNGWWAQDAAEQAIQTGEQIITSAENVLQTVEQVAQTAQQIQMVYNLVKSVSTLGDVTSLVNIGNDLTLQSEEVATLMNTVDGLNYTAGTMRQQFETLYPNGTDWSTYDFNNLKSISNERHGIQQQLKDIQVAKSGKVLGLQKQKIGADKLISQAAQARQTFQSRSPAGLARKALGLGKSGILKSILPLGIASEGLRVGRGLNMSEEESAEQFRRFISDPGGAIMGTDRPRTL